MCGPPLRYIASKGLKRARLFSSSAAATRDSDAFFFTSLKFLGWGKRCAERVS